MKDKEDREKEIQKYLNTVHCMDCLEFMKGLPDKCIDIVLTDPPYGIGADKKAKASAGKKSLNGLAYKKDYGYTDRDNIRPSKEYFDEIQRISGNAIIFGGNYFSSDLTDSSCWIVWDKNINGNFADCELAWTNFHTATRLFKRTWNGMLQEDMGNKEYREHPTQKPVPLFRRILENYSKEGMTILDPFAGSGTTGIACKELGRNYILVEKEQKYVDIINKRLQNTTVSLFH